MIRKRKLSIIQLKFFQDNFRLYVVIVDKAEGGMNYHLKKFWLNGACLYAKLNLIARLCCRNIENYHVLLLQGLQLVLSLFVFYGSVFL